MSQQINLFNTTLRKRGFAPTGASSMLLGLGAVVAIALLYGLYQDYRTREAARQAQEVARQHAEATARRDMLVAQQAGQQPDAALESELLQLEWRLRGRQDIVDALNSGVLGTTGGFAGYLRAFSRQSIDGLWLTGLDIAASGNELQIHGRTLSADLVPTYLKRLNQEPAMQGRRFAELRISLPKAVTVAAQRATAAEVEMKAGPVPTDGAAPKAETQALPRYLEFSLVSLPLEAGQKVPDPPSSGTMPNTAQRVNSGGMEPAK